MAASRLRLEGDSRGINNVCDRVPGLQVLDNCQSCLVARHHQLEGVYSPSLSSEAAAAICGHTLEPEQILNGSLIPEPDLDPVWPGTAGWIRQLTDPYPGKIPGTQIITRIWIRFLPDPAVPTPTPESGCQ